MSHQSGFGKVSLLYGLAATLLTGACGDEQGSSSESSSGGGVSININGGKGGASIGMGTGGAPVAPSSGGTTSTVGGQAIVDPTPAGTNLIKNGDFGLGAENWVLSESYQLRSATFTDGVFCISNPSSGDYMSFELNYPIRPLDATFGSVTNAFVVASGSTYTLSYRAYAWSRSGLDIGLLHLNVQIQRLTSPQSLIYNQQDDDSVGASYATVTHEVPATSGATAAALIFDGVLYFDGNLCIDDVSLVRN